MVKVREERLKTETEGRQNKPLKSKKKCMSEISIRSHGWGQWGRSGEGKKNKRANVCGVVKGKQHKSPLQGQIGEEGVGKNDG